MWCARLPPHHHCCTSSGGIIPFLSSSSPWASRSSSRCRYITRNGVRRDMQKESKRVLPSSERFGTSSPTTAPVALIRYIYTFLRSFPSTFSAAVIGCRSSTSSSTATDVMSCLDEMILLLDDKQGCKSNKSISTSGQNSVGAVFSSQAQGSAQSFSWSLLGVRIHE